MSAKLHIDGEAVGDFCRRNHIRRMALFGSVLRDDFRPDSDVDVLVEFAPDARIGLIGFAGLEIELSAMLGREVDLNTAEDLSRYYRDEVVKSAEVVYAAALGFVDVPWMRDD